MLEYNTDLLFRKIRQTMTNRTNRQQRTGALLLTLGAFIWGVAFVAQSEGGDAIGPYTFNGTRFIIGGLVLLPVLALTTREERKIYGGKVLYGSKILWIGGIACGVALTIASNLQQVGITLGTPAGKAGFLTACYIILVPIAGLFLGRKCPARVWLAVAITLVGLYLLCMSESLTLSGSDLLLLASAVGFTLQILLVDYYAPQCNPIALSILEFLTCGILTMLPALAFEIIPDPSGMLASFQTKEAWIPLLYAGLLSTGVSYTFQIIGQKSVHPTIASLLMSLESVFAVLAGWVLLGEHLTMREGFGCVLIFVAIILAQL